MNKIKTLLATKAGKLILAIVFIAAGFVLGHMDMDTAIQLITEVLNNVDTVGQTVGDAVVTLPAVVN